MACAGGLSAGPAVAAGCPDEALRVGPSAALPECRAYEMVSPPGKNDGFVERRYADQSSLEGDRIAFLSTSAFGGAEAGPSFGVYLARRDGSTAWSTSAVDPPTVSSEGLLELVSTALSRNLDYTLQTSKVALVPGAVEGGSNVYVRNNQTGALTLVKSAAGSELFYAFEYGGAFAGGSPDWSHLVLRSSAPLVEGPAPGIPNVYDFTGGQVEAVDRLEDGEIPPGGATVPTGEVGAVSEDGTRVFFALGSTSGGPLYMREDDRTTTPISISQKEGPEEGEVKPAVFVGASADGSVVYFTSSAELTDASHTHGMATLYRFDLADGKVTDLTPTAESAPEGVGAQGFDVSEDGSTVYFAARAALAPGATPTTAEGLDLYAWHDGTISFIAQTDHLPGVEGAPAQTVASPDGEHFAFVTSAPLTSNAVASPDCINEGRPEYCARDSQVYEYELATGSLACLSCDGPATGPSDLGNPAKLSEHPARAVLDDGSVFFDTPSRLVPADSNGIDDVYLWRAGNTQLISTGTSAQPSIFGDATADGSNVYFSTDQRLVGIDVDSATDLYDAKVDGGLGAQNPPGSPPPCEGEGCRGASPRGPSALAPDLPGPTCAGLSRRAHRSAGAAGRARRRADSASPHAVGRLRRIALRSRLEARRAGREADRCRRAVR